MDPEHKIELALPPGRVDARRTHVVAMTTEAPKKSEDCHDKDTGVELLSTYNLAERAKGDRMKQAMSRC